MVSTFPDRSQPLERTVEMLKYCGFRWVRGGIEGLTADGPTSVQTFLELHRQTGVRISWGLGSSGTRIEKLLETSRPLDRAGALSDVHLAAHELVGSAWYRAAKWAKH